MSASSTLASTCMRRRFSPISNRTGVAKLAATVWPTSTWRLITVPDTGDRMLVRSRSSSACARAALRCSRFASALVMAARAMATCASEVSTRVTSWSSSDAEMYPRSTRARRRSSSRRACPSVAAARTSSASRLSMFASATVTSARFCWTRASNVRGSMRATRSPASTVSLKSASSSVIWPESWEPTMTVLRARRVPDETTTLSMSPGSTVARVYSSSPEAGARA